MDPEEPERPEILEEPDVREDPELREDSEQSSDDDEEEFEDISEDPDQEENGENARPHIRPRIFRNVILDLTSHNEFNDEDSSSEEEDGEERQQFDRGLPSRHVYLGEANELQGRTILEDDLIQELVIMSHPGIVLMPGQTLPLTLFRHNDISAIERIIHTTKTFGILYESFRYRDLEEESKEYGQRGTTAEIYEYLPPGCRNIGFNLKVKGRQRFKVISARSQIDGIKIAKVMILNETELPEPMYKVRLQSRDKLRCPFEEVSDQGSVEHLKENRKRKSFMRESLSELLSRLKSKKQPKLTPETNAEGSKFTSRYENSPRNVYRNSVYSAPLTPFPNWVFEQYDAKILVAKILRALDNFKLFSGQKSNIPQDPVQLSYWLATNIPLTDSHRLKILGLDFCVQRLRYGLSLLERCQILCCVECHTIVAKSGDIFSMSQEGLQNAYVNPGGIVHETLTLHKTKNVQLVGKALTEHSWFPGYAWTIANCKHCQGHLGWKFTACEKKLDPRKFWGVSRKSIISLADLDIEKQIFENRVTNEELTATFVI